MATRVQLDFPLTGDPAFRARAGAVSYGGLASVIRAAAARWHQRRLLAELDERMLRDIGISRSQALAEAGKPCWRR
jgi:uncharacterized protein YjiS (DUF1127 family)